MRPIEKIKDEVCKKHYGEHTTYYGVSELARLCLTDVIALACIQEVLQDIEAKCYGSEDNFNPTITQQEIKEHRESLK